MIITDVYFKPIFSFGHQPMVPQPFFAQALKRILVASNGMAAAKVMMSMRQWAHMEALPWQLVESGNEVASNPKSSKLWLV